MVASGQGACLSFDIDRVSTQASKILISNVSVKLDRTVPLTNKQYYQAIVWGSAIAENYGLEQGGKKWKADFNTPGASVDYIRVISAANDQPGILTQEVRVPVGESYYTVNGVAYDMDAKAYISSSSHSTMVPVRFVANAFGLRDDNQIVWDNINKTVTIIAPWLNTVQFTVGKSEMIVGSATVTMFSPDNLPVSAENVGSRVYVPFRALGQAFGIPVSWDADTNTAIYNKGANDNVAASLTNAVAE